MADQAQSSTLSEVIQSVLDHPDLQQYYHVEALPERKPLVIVKNDALSAEPALVKFDVPVVYRTREALEASGGPYMEFTRLDIDPDSARVEFSYPVEGVRGSASLSRESGGWIIEDFSIYEE